MAWNDNRRLRVLQSARGFHEQYRVLRLLRPALLRMLAIIQTDTKNIGRHNRSLETFYVHRLFCDFK